MEDACVGGGFAFADVDGAFADVDGALVDGAWVDVDGVVLVGVVSGEDAA